MAFEPERRKTTATAELPGGFWRRMLAASGTSHRAVTMALALALVPVIGTVDYLTGFELSLLVFYFIPVFMAVASAGWRFGTLIAVLSVATWLVGDFRAGAHFSNPFVPGWNAVIALGIYLVVVWLISSVLALHREMERRVADRTAALTDEIAERVRLERAVLEITERERRSIGHDLHDGLSQHLTGTALVAKALASRMAARDPEGAGELEQVIAHIEQGIEQTRSLARGLLLAEISRDGLETALAGLARSISEKQGVLCEFESANPVSLEESGTATHVYRIAEEAARNALRHARATRISISLALRDGVLSLAVSDNGAGIPPAPRQGEGLGLRIMAHRAAILGGKFSVGPGPAAGTVVSCQVPLAQAP